MDTIEIEAQAEAPDGPEEPSGTTHRARGVVADAADAARAAVETHTPAVRGAAEAARSAVQSHAPGVLGAGRATATSAYGQVRRAPDEQLALGTAFAAGLVSGFVLARVPRPLLILALVPLTVLGGTLLGRKVPFMGRALRPPD